MGDTMRHKAFAGTIALLTFLLLTCPAWAQDADRAHPLLEGLTMEKSYEAGLGKPVGKIIAIQGKAALFHEGQKRAFWMINEMPLFKGDTVITLEDASLEIGLIDASRLSVGSKTRLVVNEMLYSQTAAERSGFLTVTQGKARFWIKKLIRFRRSEFRVKTTTSIAGVRGSDFITWVKPEFTEFVTFEKTVLEVLKLSDPEADPVILTDFQRVRDRMGKLISQPKSMDQDIINSLRRDLPFIKSLSLGSPITVKLPAGHEGAGDNAGLIPEDKLVAPDLEGSPVMPFDKQAMEMERREKLKSMTRQGIQTRYEDILDDKQWDLVDFPAPPE